MTGNALNLSWGPPASGGTTTSYTVIARTTLGAVIASPNVGNTTTFGATVPNGVYVLSVRAGNASGPGPETAPRTVTVPESVQAPGAPRNLTGTVSGTSVTFAWTPPAPSGGPVEGYVLRASTSPGGPPIATLSLAGFVTQTTVPGVPAGTYYATVSAANTTGSSPASNMATVTVGTASSSRSTLNPPGVPTSIEARTSQIFATGIPVQMFDDFTFAGGSTFRQISWQGIYCVAQSNSPAPAPTATAFVISIYADRGGRPNTTSPLASVPVPLAQVNQTANGNFRGATCDAATNTTWSLYSYAVTLPSGFAAAPGVRYWFSVQAVTPSSAVFWGWRSGTTDNRSSLQLFNGTYAASSLDRAFALTP